MGMLSEWLYPGSKLHGKATMSDGGNPLLQSVKCTAVLTTADPIEKVVEFYTAKFDKPALSETMCMSLASNAACHTSGSGHMLCAVRR